MVDGRNVDQHLQEYTVMRKRGKEASVKTTDDNTKTEVEKLYKKVVNKTGVRRKGARTRPKNLHKENSCADPERGDQTLGGKILHKIDVNETCGTEERSTQPKNLQKENSCADPERGTKKWGGNVVGTNGFYCLIRKTLAKKGKRNCQSSEAKSFYRSGVRTRPECPVSIPGQRPNPLGHRAPCSIQTTSPLHVFSLPSFPSFLSDIVHPSWVSQAPRVLSYCADALLFGPWVKYMGSRFHI